MSKLDTFISVIVIGACVIKAIAYGGSKPPPSSTNEPPDNISGDSSPTNDPPLPPPTMMAMLPPPSLTANSQQPTAISNWTARGAWCDWKRIEFGDSFSFPSGTNLLTGVTLMSYGELRSSLHSLTANSQQLTAALAALPQAVSLEPDMSSVSYGLTPSNSFVFIWENACVNREATNRVNATIELFQNGTIAVSTRSDVQPSTYNLQPPVVPEGYYGQGQNEEWSTNTFAFAADEIAEKGYQGWLDDYVGINEPNGRYRCSVTIAALPEHGPCYLVVGPYRMVVTAPGTYDFPLMVCEEYDAYTCPEAVPLTFSYDDGFRSDDSVVPPWMMTAAPAPLFAATDSGQEHRNKFRIGRIPEVIIIPDHIPVNQAENTPLTVWCNVPNANRSFTAMMWDQFSMIFLGDTEARINRVLYEDIVAVDFNSPMGTFRGWIHLTPPWYYPGEEPQSTNDWENGSSTNNSTNGGNP